MMADARSDFRSQEIATRLFEKLQIDYCCGGSRPLTEACKSAGLEVSAVMAMLEADSQADPSE